jgi:integrase/recombinase XerD
MESEKLGLITKFISMMELRNFSPMTIKAYCHHFERFMEFKKGTHLSILSSQDINDYLVYLVDQDASTSKLNQVINSIRFFFKFVLNRKIKGYLVIRPKKAKTSPILLSDSEIADIFNACQNKKHLAIMYLMYGAGLRVSEVINLKIEHIDSKNMLIHVRDCLYLQCSSLMIKLKNSYQLTLPFANFGEWTAFVCLVGFYNV